MDDATGRADLDAVAVEMSRPRRVVLPEDLIGRVDEMNNHVASLTRRGPAACRLCQASRWRWSAKEKVTGAR
jgi:hypothetical protein